MPKFETMPASEAPQPVSKATQQQQRLYESFLVSLQVDDVGMLTPEGQESPRAIKLRLGKAAKALGKDIQVWDVEGKVYFKPSAERAKRGRPRKQQETFHV